MQFDFEEDIANKKRLVRIQEEVYEMAQGAIIAMLPDRERKERMNA